MKTFRLDQCCRIVSGATPKTSKNEYWDGDVLWVTPKDLNSLEGIYISDTPRKLTISGLESCSAELLPANSVLLSSRAPIGYVAINSVPMATNQGFKSLVPDLDLLDARYLYFWLKEKRSYLEALGNGATFKEISKAVVSRVEIELPSLDFQIRAANILELVDSLRAKRRKALEQLNALAQAIFIEMFGDPVLNPKGWETKRLGELGRVVTGNTPSRSRADYYGGEVEWIKSDNINSPSYYLTEAVERLTQAGKAVARVVPAGSVLVTCIAGSPECIGNAGLADREVAFNQQINALVPERVESHFLYAHFLFGKKLVQRASTSGMKGMVSKSKFEEIEFIYPPHELQNEYSQKIRHIQKVRERCQQANAELDALFSSLQHRAFRGEL